MIRPLSVFAVGYILLSPSYSFADVGQIQALLDSGKFKQAYALANTYIDEFEGDPAFDFSYGVAAVDSGNPSEGVFALERVLLIEPDNHLATLELARGYFFLEQYDLAHQLFTDVLTLNPPALVQARIHSYLKQITERTQVVDTRFKGFVELWAGYDSNINSGPDTETNVVILSNDALSHSDQYNQVRVGGSVDHDYAVSGSLFFSANVDARYYHTESEQDYKSFNLAGGHRWNLDQQQYQIGFSAQKYVLDNEDYRDMLGANLGWNKQLGANALLRTSFSIYSLSYDHSADKDSTQMLLSSNYLYAGKSAWNPIWFVGVFFGDENPDVSNPVSDALTNRKFYGMNGGVQLSPNTNLTITPSLVYQASRYRGEDWIYKVKRSDDYSALNLNAEWTLQKNWTLMMNYNYAVADSNIELYEYDRQQVMFGLRYNFN